MGLMLANLDEIDWFRRPEKRSPRLMRDVIASSGMLILAILLVERVVGGRDQRSDRGRVKTGIKAAARGQQTVEEGQW